MKPWRCLTAGPRAIRLARGYRLKWLHAERIATEATQLVDALECGAVALRERNSDLRARLTAAERHIADAEATIQSLLTQRDAALEVQRELIRRGA